jgi:glyoxylase-like metal-dependent hydrolase (beta-lactamase superfamily II)
MPSLPKTLMSRRGFCLCCIAAASGSGWLTPRQAYAEARGLVTLIKDSAATSPIATHKLRSNISVLEGSGGNIAVLTGADGKVLVDGGIAVSRARMAKTLDEIGGEPIKHLINTHWHFDHADGNDWLHSAGAKIIASDVFAKDHHLKLNGQSITLKYYGPAHTDGDISAHFAEANIFHVGDTFWNGIYPFIDHSTGGSIGGMIAACDATLAATDNDSLIIPGHGKPVSNKTELKEFRDMLAAIRDNVAKLKKEGKTRDDAVAAKPTADFDAKWGQFVIDPAFFTRLVYESA